MNDFDIINKEFLQKCGDSLFVISFSYKKKGHNWFKCIFKKYSYEIIAREDNIKNGSILNPQIEIEEFVNKIWPQNCGDSLKILEKTTKKNYWKCKFLKYPYQTLASKSNIQKGVVNNPQIEIEEFVKKIWLQNCGDSLKIIKKSEIKPGYWECEFIKYPYKVCRSKLSIKNGNVLNPIIEQNEFIGRVIPQACGDSLKIIQKTDKIIRGETTYYCKFIKYPYEVYALKSDILKGYIKNYNLPYFSKENLSNFIDNNFLEKPTLEELSQKLNICYSHINHIINKFELKSKIKLYISKPENEIKKFLFDITKDNYFNHFLKNGQEIDIYIPNKNLGIEYNGNFWHSNHPKFGVPNNYHQQKSLEGKQESIQIMHIFEYEWKQKQEIIKSLIKSKLGIFNKKIGASKCKIKELDYKEYANFCNENHLQGECGAKIKLGLFYRNELVQVMSFGSPRFTLDFDWEIIRECSKLGYIIIGGKEKLWKYFLRKYSPKNCISYCDFSKFTGESYLKLEFKKERLNKPGFVWFNKKDNIIYWRNPYKNKEMKEKGYLKIYDCGQLVFTWYK